MLTAVTKIITVSLLFILPFTVMSNEIYKTIDKDGNVSFSAIAPMNETIVETVSVKKLIKRISVINDASAQNEKIKAITKRLTDSRLQRNKKRNKKTKSYKEEISLIKNKRLEGLKKLQDETSTLNSKLSESEQLKKSVREMLKQNK